MRLRSGRRGFRPAGHAGRGLAGRLSVHFTAAVPHRLQVANWFTSTHPNSRFRNNLMVQRLLPYGRISLHNRRLSGASDGRPTSGCSPVPPTWPLRWRSSGLPRRLPWTTCSVVSRRNRGEKSFCFFFFRKRRSFYAFFLIDLGVDGVARVDPAIDEVEQVEHRPARHLGLASSGAAALCGLSTMLGRANSGLSAVGRLACEHVHTGRLDGAVGQRRGQRGLVDDRAAGGVDQPGRRLHPLEEVGVRPCRASRRRAGSAA